jgi:hypothetical protein
MTHDELLEEIDDRFSDTCDAHCESCSTKNFPIKALRAVVELHKPISDNSCYDPGCCGGPYPDLCGICSEHYPCETIEAIEKELSNG